MITDSNISQVFQSALCTRFSPTIPAHLCALPGELLELICSFIGEWDVFPCRKRSIYLILSHTSKRLRDFCLPLYFRRARIANVSDLWDYTRFLESAGHKDSIRYLRLGTREFARYWRKASNYRERAAVLAMAAPCKSHSFHETALPRLPSLQEFICMDNTFRVSSLAASFRHSPLRRLSVAWNDDRFPDIGNMFPELQHLCLVLAIKQVNAEFPIPTSKLTSLVVCHYRLSPEICRSFNECFPNLHSLSLYETKVDSLEIFSIIKTTPSLSEVIYRPDPYVQEDIYLGHLIATIIGNQSCAIDKPYEPANRWPPGYTWRNVTFLDFAFVRKPMQQEEEDSAAESRSKYNLLSLTLEQRWYTPDTDDGKDNLMEILASFPFEPGLKNIEELCVAVVIHPMTNMTFTRYMADVAHRLLRWPSLRRFSFAEDLIPFCTWTNQDDNYIFGLDSIQAPARMVDVDVDALVSLLTIGDFESIYGDEDWVDETIGAQVRHVLELPDDAKLDPHIEVMPIWEARHEMQVADTVRRMADCCPALKEFVWYVGQLAEKDKPVSWQWKIYRKDNGAVNWIQGSLYWPASCRPVFPSFREWALVGQERTSMEKYKWPRTAIWP